MKNNLLICLLLLSGFRGIAQTDLHQLYFNDINGQSTAALDSSSQLTVFVILPGVTVDTIILRQLQHFQQRYGDTVRVIGVLSREDGYNDADQDSVRNLYQSLLQAGLVLTEGLYSHSSSDSLQSPLLHWLTDINSNRYSGMDISGVGEKFFINGNGILYAVMGGDVALDGELIANSISSHINN